MNKKPNKINSSDTTIMKQSLRNAKYEVKCLKEQLEKLANILKQKDRLIDELQTFINTYTDHISLEEALDIAKKNKIKKTETQKLKEKLRKEYGRKAD